MTWPLIAFAVIIVFMLAAVARIFIFGGPPR